MFYFWEQKLMKNQEQILSDSVEVSRIASGFMDEYMLVRVYRTGISIWLKKKVSQKYKTFFI